MGAEITQDDGKARIEKDDPHKLSMNEWKWLVDRQLRAASRGRRVVMWYLTQKTLQKMALNSPSEDISKS